MKFREHRGSLSDSMATVVEVEGFDGLLSHLKKLARDCPTMPPLTRDTVTIGQYGGVDQRTGWGIDRPTHWMRVSSAPSATDKDQA